MRKRILGLALAVIAVGGTVSAVGAPEAEAGTRIVYVDWQGNSTWPVKYSADVVDRQTGSVFRFGTCRSGYKCIIIREQYLRSEWAAYTSGILPYYSSTNRARIYLNPQRRSYSWAGKRAIVTHELAHAMGVNWHSEYCSNVMWPRVTCSNGRVAPFRFTDSQVRRLRVN